MRLKTILTIIFIQFSFHSFSQDQFYDDHQSESGQSESEELSPNSEIVVVPLNYRQQRIIRENSMNTFQAVCEIAFGCVLLPTTVGSIPGAILIIKGGSNLVKRLIDRRRMNQGKVVHSDSVIGGILYALTKDDGWAYAGDLTDKTISLYIGLKGSYQISKLVGDQVIDFVPMGLNVGQIYMPFTEVNGIVSVIEHETWNQVKAQFQSIRQKMHMSENSLVTQDATYFHRQIDPFLKIDQESNH